MAEPFTGEICIFAFDYAPQDWALANGAEMPIQQNQALYSLLGVKYGGDAKTVFKLPDLRGRLPLGMGQGHSQAGNLTPRTIAQTGGAEFVALSVGQMPGHAHIAQISATTNDASSAQPVAGGYLAAAVDSSGTGATPAIYGSGGTPPMVALGGGTTSSVGGGQPVALMNPFLVLNFCIALSGLYPMRA